MHDRGIFIARVADGSPAARAGIAGGDRLLSVNGRRPKDLLDYRYQITGERVRLRIRRQEQGTGVVWIEKEEDDDLGLIFDSDCYDGIKRCRNRCLFCFIDQLPGGLRPSLYLKDDDYRLSYLHGNFITLTNLDQTEWERIKTFKYSPLYLSVHTTDPRLRGRMLGRRSPAPVVEQIAALTGAGINLHLQIVLCPDLNDREELERTIGDLARFYPGVVSVGVVPVGLTGYRHRLPGLRNFTRAECRRVIRQVSVWQSGCRERWGVDFVYLADEFYLRAGWPLPPAKHYDGYPQLENGIGLARNFLDNFHRSLHRLPKRLPRPRRFVLITGKAAVPVLAGVVARLNLITNLQVVMLPLGNRFFGKRITVAGLLTGSDLISGLSGRDQERVLIPRQMLPEGSERFLDGLTVAEVAAATGCQIWPVADGAEGLIEMVTKGVSFGRNGLR